MATDSPVRHERTAEVDRYSLYDRISYYLTRIRALESIVPVDGTLNQSS